jgi:predicted CopG family antitoxin
MAQTTIQISKELLEKLKARKFSEKESYEDVIWDLMEDTMELSEETKKNIAISRQQYKEGKVHSWEDVKKRLSLNV